MQTSRVYLIASLPLTIVSHEILVIGVDKMQFILIFFSVREAKGDLQWAVITGDRSRKVPRTPRESLRP